MKKYLLILAVVISSCVFDEGEIDGGPIKSLTFGLINSEKEFEEAESVRLIFTDYWKYLYSAVSSKISLVVRVNLIATEELSNKDSIVINLTSVDSDGKAICGVEGVDVVFYKAGVDSNGELIFDTLYMPKEGGGYIGKWTYLYDDCEFEKNDLFHMFPVSGETKTFKNYRVDLE